MTLADTIREISREHCEAGGLLLGQNLNAIQDCCGTVPVDAPNVTVMPTTETAGMGIAVGAALSGRRVIHVIRFSSFLWLQSSPLVNYAARCKEIWRYSCPIFVRAMGFDNYGSGPIHTGLYHSPFMHVPGITVVAPMTSEEYTRVWEDFMAQAGPYLVSEHRSSYGNEGDDAEWSGWPNTSEVTVFAISAARANAYQAMKMLWREKIRCAVVPICYLKPLRNFDFLAESLKKTGRGIVVDSSYTICGAAEHIAYELMVETGYPVKALGMEDRSSGIAPGLENITPSAERIAQAARELLRR